MRRDIHLVVWLRATTTTNDEDLDTLLASSRSIARQLRERGGRVIASIGGSMAALFPQRQKAATIAFLESWVKQSIAEDRPEGTRAIAVGLSEGVVYQTEDAPAFSGDALDRAQCLAHVAEPGTIRMDDALAADRREMFAKPLDSVLPEASAPEAPSLDSAFHQLASNPEPRVDYGPWRPLIDSFGAESPAIGLRGNDRETLDLLCRVAERQFSPTLVLHVRGGERGIVPLGSLRDAFLERWERPAIMATQLEALGVGDSRSILAHLAAGESTEINATTCALEDLLDALPGGHRPWVVLHDASVIDAATFQVLARAAHPQRRNSPLFIVLLIRDERVPAAIRREWSFEERVVDPLDVSCSREFAAALLCVDADASIAHQIAALGHPSPLAIESAARALIGSGELVFANGGFRLDTKSPRPNLSWLDERIQQLEDESRTFLELVCLAPRSTPDGTIETAAASFGLRGERQRDAIESLITRALLKPQRPFQAPSEALRVRVRSLVTSDRRKLLCLPLANELGARLPGEATFARASLALLWAEAGQNNLAAAAMLAASAAAAENGYRNCVMKLTAAAVEFDPSEENRRQAALITKSAESRPPAADPVTIRDVSVGLEKKNEPNGQVRDRLGRAIALVSEHEASKAVRHALQALSESREKNDPRGEQASLYTLSICYRALERDHDADALQEAAKRLDSKVGRAQP